MSFIPNTDNDRKQMLDAIGVGSFEELINNLPSEIRLKGELNLPNKMSEFEVSKMLSEYAAKNVSSATHTCFMGGGAYDHFIPAVVGFVLERPEFKTAYTPYQAEVSQGTLQAMYEFQSMICAMTGMDAANASMYDCGTSIAEACLMAHAHNRRSEVVYAGTVNPHYRNVVTSVTQGKNLTFKSAIAEDGTCDLAALAEMVTDATSAVVVQHPNGYGTLEDVKAIEKIAHEHKCVFVVITDMISLGLLEAPGEYGADVVVAEGQTLGIPLSFGGPYLGIFAVKKALVRKMPGRICGITQDTTGDRGFVLTLQTREQHIKRENATSNICSNQGLMMLAATVYMATMGKQGIRETAELCLQKAHYLAENIKKIPGFKVSAKPFFREFLVETPVPAAEIVQAAEKEGILAGVDTARFPECKQGLLIAVTEKRTKEEMDKYIDLLKKFGK